ncbi:hypothetical protein [Actinoplanes sp. G11-F43]|uniref:hypothetical protein n=1 Tax=Actinoplanes sp. G11-F43 TaxID=3424130 RepID=UPI003D341416
MSEAPVFQVVVSDGVKWPYGHFVGRCLVGDIIPGTRFTRMALPGGREMAIDTVAAEMWIFRDRPATLISAGLSALIRFDPPVYGPVDGAIMS